MGDSPTSVLLAGRRRKVRGDLSELHSRSVRPRLRRNFFEIAQGSEKLAQGTLPTGFASHHARSADGMEQVQQMLALKEFDPVAQFQEVRNLHDHLVTKEENETFVPTQIDELLDYYQEVWTRKNVCTAWDRAEVDVQTMHRRWAAEDWLNAKQQYMESLGYRTQKWNPELAAQSTDSAMVVVGQQGSSGAQTKKFHGQRMSSMAQRHANVIRAAAMAREPTAIARNLTLAISETIDERWAKQLDTNEDEMNQQELIGYKDAVKMLSEIVGESMDAGNCPEAGTYSSICFREQDTGVASRRARFTLTLGAKRHLEQQKYEDLSAEIDEAVRNGRLRVSEADAAESLQQRIRSYVGFNYHMGSYSIPSDAAFSSKHASISETMKVKVPVWVFVYYCLRVGEVLGAINEIERCRSEGARIDEAALVCLRMMAQLSEPNSPELTPIQRKTLYDAMYRCQILFQEECDKPVSAQAQSRDPFKALVLNLLSIGADQESMSELLAVMLESDFQIEDFLWGSLWFAVWSRVALLEDMRLQGVMAQMQNGLGNLRTKGEEALYQQIVAMGGADYFAESNCFVYCRVLLTCQKYGEAILHLWRRRKPLAAVHLSTICMHYGLILPHRPLNYNPADASAIGTQRRMTQPDIISDPTPAALLRVYIAAPFLLDYCEESVDYLMFLNSKWLVGAAGISESMIAAERLLFENMKTTELTNLITAVGRSQLQKLVGGPENSLVGRGRSGGYLDLYMDQQDVDYMLSKAAHYLLTQARDSKGAVHVYQLAGRYYDALEEMIVQLGVELVPSNGATGAQQTREAWIQQCKGFFERTVGNHRQLQMAPMMHRLSSRDSRVEVLAATLEVMLHLCQFMDACSQLCYGDALRILDSIDFSFDDRLLSMFPHMHRAVQQSFDVLLHTAMECVKHLFLEARERGMGGEAEYRKRAGAIARFANSISSFIQPSTASTLNRIEIGLI